MAIAEPVATQPGTGVLDVPRLRARRAAVVAWLSVGVAPVALSATLAAVGATVWSGYTHSMLLYGDARAHLDVARRVTDGLRTGPAQLGSVWLPLPHILMVPLTFFRPLWHSGAAGAVVGGVCFVYAVVRMFSVVEELSGNRAGAWCAAAVMAGNLNLLYLQSTALTEPVLLAFIAGTAFHLARWMRTFSVRELGWAALLTAAATLTRYEGWALLVGALAVVIVWSRLADRRRNSGEASAVLFASVAGYGVVMWFLYNLIIFHDPLYFLHSIYSAHSIESGYAHVGRLVTEHHLLASVVTYGWSVVGVIGPVMLVTAAVAAIIVGLDRRGQRRTLVILAVLLAPVLFEVVSLYLGQTTILVPQRAPRGMWNDRYAVVALPAVALAIGCAVGRWRRLAPVAVGLVGLAVVFMGLGTPMTVADGRTGTSSAAAGHKEVAAAFLHAHYRGGEVLVDDASATPFIFASDLDLKAFVTVGAHPYWEDALRSPASSVAWVVATPHDAVATDMTAHPARFTGFHQVVTEGSLSLYERNG